MGTINLGKVYMASTKNIFVKIINCRSRKRRHYRTSLKKAPYQICYTLRETYYQAIDMEESII